MRPFLQERHFSEASSFQSGVFRCQRIAIERQARPRLAAVVH
jgi:hypothetical protein